jgi:AraC-like DNA-binding protein
MLFHCHKPRPPLCEFVDNIWLYQDYAGVHEREMILPSGTFEMVFNLQEDELRIYGPRSPAECRRYTGAIISGPYAGSFMSDAAEEASIIGVHFKPGGAFAVLGISAGELANTHIDLSAVWGHFAAELREQLCALAKPMERIELLERALLARLCDAHIAHGAVGGALAVLMCSGGQAMVRDIARAVDLSQRRLIALFTDQVGLTPKLFGRVQRFQRAVARAQCAGKVDWAQVAADCGYFDQSHLIRDFVEFSGMSPAGYRHRHEQLDRAAVHMKSGHLPLAGGSIFSNTPPAAAC